MRTSVAALAFVLAGTGACSDDTREVVKDPPSDAALERAFREFQGAYLDGDGERAYRLISDHCRGVTSRSDMVRLADEYADFMRGDDDVRLTIVRVDRRPSNADEATVMYTIVDYEDPMPDHWVVEDGEWRHDSC